MEMNLAKKVMLEAQMGRVGRKATTVGTHADTGHTVVTYHETPVVKFNDNEIVLDSGGWKTATTRVRMNQASNQYELGFQVYQKNGEWFVNINGKTIPFEDGMSIPREGMGEGKSVAAKAKDVKSNAVTKKTGGCTKNLKVSEGIDDKVLLRAIEDVKVKMLEEMNRIMSSGAVGEDTSPGAIITAALYNIADGYGRGNTEWKNLRRF